MGTDHQRLVEGQLQLHKSLGYLHQAHLYFKEVLQQLSEPPRTMPPLVPIQPGGHSTPSVPTGRLMPSATTLLPTPMSTCPPVTKTVPTTTSPLMTSALNTPTHLDPLTEHQPLPTVEDLESILCQIA
jgi:hypothetical protein